MVTHNVQFAPLRATGRRFSRLRCLLPPAALALTLCFGACKDAGVDTDTANILHLRKDSINFSGAHADSIGVPGSIAPPVRRMMQVVKLANGKKDTVNFMLSDPVVYSHVIAEDTLMSFGLSLRAIPKPGDTVQCADCPTIQAFHLNIPRMRVNLKMAKIGPIPLTANPDHDAGAAILYLFRKQGYPSTGVATGDSNTNGKSVGNAVLYIDPERHTITVMANCEFVSAYSADRLAFEYQVDLRY